MIPLLHNKFLFFIAYPSSSYDIDFFLSYSTQVNVFDGDKWIINCNKIVEMDEDGTKVIKST